jgi:outer membrane immunogenic protein
MKQVGLAVAGVLALLQPAFAADLGAAGPVYAPEFSAEPASSWGGWYFGLNAGYGWASYDGVFDNSELPAFPGETTFISKADPAGGVFGLHTGYNFQNGATVWGIEADAMFGGISGQTADGGGDDVARAQLNFLGSLRGRGGIAAGNTLFYATAGAALGNSKYTVIDDKGEPGQNKGSLSFTSGALVAGAGVEHKLGRNMSVRLEGLYYWFDGDKHNTSNLTNDSDPGDFVSLKDAAVLRAGFSLHY